LLGRVPPFIPRGMWPADTPRLPTVHGVPRRGYIDYSTWLAAMLDWRKLQGSQKWNDWVDAVFEEFQTEGKIGKEELRRMLAVEDGAEV